MSLRMSLRIREATTSQPCRLAMAHLIAGEPARSALNGPHVEELKDTTLSGIHRGIPPVDNCFSQLK
jgi:hypothetical protein